MCCPPRGGSISHQTQTKFGGFGNLSNLIAHAKFEINWYKIVPLAEGESFMFSTPLTRLSPACDQTKF